MRLCHRGTQTIWTKRLVLRRVGPLDAEEMYRNWAGDPEVARYLVWAPSQDLDSTREYLTSVFENYAHRDTYHWGVEKDGELIGSVGVVRKSDENFRCELGYCLSRRFWGQGIMTEAVRAAIGYLFQVGYHRVGAMHDSRNPASGRVMQKAGMRFEGVMRESHLARDGVLADMICYSILRGEWE